MFKTSFIIALMALLVACGSQPVPEDAPHDTPGDSWRMLAKLGIRSTGYNGSVLMDWHNTKQDFTVALTGMLGVKLARISSDDGVIELQVPDKPLRILTAGELQIYLGYELPIAHLPHWVRGQPNPDVTATPQDLGFDQAGWRVEYLKYQVSVPRKMRFSYGDTRLTLLIRKWDF